MRIGLLLGFGCALFAGTAVAQTTGGPGGPPSAYGAGGATGTTGGGVAPREGSFAPREAWQRYLAQQGAQQGGQGASGSMMRFGRPGMMRRPMGPMGGAMPGMGGGAVFSFDRNSGKVFIRCAPSDTTQACAEGVLPLVETIMGSARGGDGDDTQPADSPAPAQGN